MKLKVSTLVIILVIIFVAYYYFITPQTVEPNVQDTKSILLEPSVTDPNQVTILDQFYEDPVPHGGPSFGDTQYESFQVTPITDITEDYNTSRHYNHVDAYNPNTIDNAAGNVRPDNYSIPEDDITPVY